MKPLQPCGTYAAYERHRRRGEPVDDACSEAAHTYSAARYRRNRRQQHAQQVARGRAHRRLAAAHHDEFQALYLRELARDTTDPQGAGR